MTPASPPSPGTVDEATPPPAERTPGFIALHGNRLEDLAEACFAWLASHPLGALEEEVFLVQSNGMAEWLKMQRAERSGVCAATRVELPARFVWRAYRAVLGREAVPSASPLDRGPLVWRCMRLLPRLVRAPGFEPVARFLATDDQPLRRLQLAERLADLFDQYQVYRSDWLSDWAEGRDRLAPRGDAVPAGEAWQPDLWRQLLEGLDESGRRSARPALHRQFLQALERAPAGARPPAWKALPRRLVLFGTTHLPHQTLEALAALSRHLQVLMVVPNPCRFHWSDLIDGRELLAAAPRRHALRGGVDLAALPFEDLHAHGHPLLAAWGRQSRDFIRQLDTFDDTQRSRAWMDMPRVDLFDAGDGPSLLQQVQAHIRELEPRPTPPADASAALPPPAAQDRSIVFHSAHSPQREVEVLHDQLLDRLAGGTAEGPLAPRDIVVMVPDIDRFAPAIRAVFGQYPRQDRRHIPWGIADQRNRGRHPVLLAMDWLLDAPRSRFTVSELRELLEVPAVARRFGFDADALAQVFDWVEGAGVRWGLDASQRDALGLAACAEAGTWRFGLQRMLLGYATGELAAPHAGVEPHAEVGGLEASLAGQLAECLGAVQAWWAESRQSRPPAAWADALRALIERFLLPDGEDDRDALGALGDGLADWLQACESAGFDEAVDLAVVREAWLEAVDSPGLGSRFKSGGVTFCTLLPLRAIPFELVCLLGMNDGDFPRRAARSDFDLMALPGQARAGDRSRRDDDRQLMLDALLSARRGLYISWSGRSDRDNQTQAPSVLVSQLRDELAARWGQPVVDARTTEHPLQPFSRRYFEAAGPGMPRPPLFTYARQWRSAHAPDGTAASAGAPPALALALALRAPDVPAPQGPPLLLDLAALGRFLRNPVAAFFAERLQVRFDDPPSPTPDDEVFTLDALDDWQLADALLARCTAQPGAAPAAALTQAVARQAAQGRLPLAGPGRVAQDRWVARLVPVLERWTLDRAEHPEAAGPLSLDLLTPEGDRLCDTVAGLRARASPHGADVGAEPTATAPFGNAPVLVHLTASRLSRDKARPSRTPDADAVRRLRLEKLLGPWLQWLAATAAGQPIGLVVIGADLRVIVAPATDAPSAAAAARTTLQGLLEAARDGLRGDRPLPTALRCGLAQVSGVGAVDTLYEGGAHARGEGEEPCLRRLYPDADALLADPGFATASERLYAGLVDWARAGLSWTVLEGSQDAGEGTEDNGDGDD